MENQTIIDRIISSERFQPYLEHHNQNQEKAFLYFQSNILISEAFYPLLSILEVGLRNSIDLK